MPPYFAFQAQIVYVLAPASRATIRRFAPRIQRLQRGDDRRLAVLATWSSSNVHVATIGSPGGVANATAKGSATITAVSGDISGSTILTVSAVVLQSITVSPAKASMVVGSETLTIQ